MDAKLETLKEPKRGIFLSSTDLPEHQKMVRCQNTYKYKLMQMQGKALPDALTTDEKVYLRSISLKEAYDKARKATFDYCAKKTDDGRDLKFIHEAGRTRFSAAVSGLKELDKMADVMELRTPAQKLIDETRMEILQKRSKDDWDQLDTERAAAKIMYAMTLEHQKVSPEEQKERLTEERMAMGIAYIREQKAFKKMMRNEGAKSVANFAVEGTEAHDRRGKGRSLEKQLITDAVFCITRVAEATETDINNIARHLGFQCLAIIMCQISSPRVRKPCSNRSVNLPVLMQPPPIPLCTASRPHRTGSTALHLKSILLPEPRPGGCLPAI